jgi:hypothetical protein
MVRTYPVQLQPIPLLTAPTTSVPVFSRNPRLKVLSKRVVFTSDELGKLVAQYYSAFKQSLCWDA